MATLELSESTKTELIEALKADGYRIEKEDFKWQPYFGKVEHAECNISEWCGHFGLKGNGDLVLCTPEGKRIREGSVCRLDDGKLTVYPALIMSKHIEHGEYDAIKVI